ncbi:MAG: domain, G-beta repeat [Planctomycetaceae bacterium]|nr:domain, G-beta repeat [Planctomycetaceae bacterium]
MRRFAMGLGLCLLGASAAYAQEAAKPAANVIVPAAVNLGRPVDFEKDVFPILDANCIACHNLAIKENNLNLEDVANIVKGGKRGPSVVAKDPDKSLLYLMVTRAKGPSMPPLPNKVEAAALTPLQVGILRQWILEGANASAAGEGVEIAWQAIPATAKAVYSVAITNDGQYVACGRANQIVIYHVPTGQQVAQLADPNLRSIQQNGKPLYTENAAHRDFVHALAFSPDGLTLASGDFRAVKLWKRPENVKRFDIAAGAAVPVVAVTADGKWLAAGGADNNIRLFNLTDGKPGKVLAGHTGPVSSLKFTADNTKLVSGSTDKSIRVWNPVDGAVLARIDTPAPVTSLTLNQDSTQIISGGADNLIRVWTVPAAPTKQIGATAIPVVAMEISPDKKFLAVPTADGKVDLIDLATSAVVKSFAGHVGAITSVGFSANSARLITGGADKTVRIWDVATGMPVALLQGNGEAVTAVGLHPNGNQAVSGTIDGKLAIWKLDVPAGVPLAGDNGQPATVAAVSFDGKKLATAAVVGGKPAIQIRDIPGGVSQTLVGHEGPISAIAFSPDGARIVSGSADKTTRIWTIADAKEVAKYAGHTNTVTAVAFHPNGQQIASGAADNTLKLLNAADGAEQKNFAGHTGAISATVIHPNGQVVSGSADGTIRFWNPADGAQVRAITHGQPVTSFALTRDGNKLAATGADANIKLYNAADGAVLFTLTGHAAAAKTVAFSAENTRLVSTGADNVAVVWDVATGELLEKMPIAAGVAFAQFAGNLPNSLVIGQNDKAIVAVTTHIERTLAGHMKAITDTLFNKGGDAVFTSSEDGTIRRYVVANGQQQFAANHGAPVYDIDQSIDGAWLASGGEDKTIKVWNAGNGGAGPKPVFAGFEAPVRSVTFAAAGQQVVGGAVNNQVLVFNIMTGLVAQAFTEHAGAIETLAATGEQEKLIVSAGADKSVKQWSLVSGIQIPGHAKPVTSLAFFLPPNGQILSGSEDNSARIWNITNAQMVRAFDLGGPVTSVAIRPDGQQIAASGANNLTRLWNAANGAVMGEIKGDLRAQRLVAKLTADDAEYKANVTNTANLIKAAETELTTRTEAAKKAAEAKVKAVEPIAPAEAKVKDATEKAAAAAKALDAKKDDAALQKAKADADKVLADAAAALKLAQDAKVAADKSADLADKAVKEQTDVLAKSKTASEMAIAKQMKGDVDLKAGQMAATATEKPWRTLAYSADGKLLAAAGDDNMVHTFNTTDGGALDLFVGHAGPITALAITADGSVVSGSADQTVKVWSLNPTWTLAGQLGPKADAPLDLRPSPFVNRVLALDFSDDGKLLAAGGGDPSRSGELMIWDVATMALVKNIVDAHSDTVFGVEFSRDGQYILSGAADKFVKIFEVATGKHVKSFEGHTHHVLDVTWKPDQTVIVSAGADNAIKVWSVDTGEQQRTIPGYTKQVTSIQWVGRSANIISCGGDGNVRYHQADNGSNFRNFPAGTDYAYSVAASFDEKVIVAGGEDGIVRVWNAVTAAPITTFEPAKPVVTQQAAVVAPAK